MTARLNGQVLPEGWIVATLDLVAHTIYRYPTFYGMEHLDKGVPVIRGEHIRDDGSISHDWSDYWYISPNMSEQFPKTVLEYQDIVMSVRGSVGKLGLVDEQLVGAQLSPNCIRIALHKWCDTRYLLYYMKSGSGQESISGNINATTIQTIKASALKNTPVPIPPLNEQHRIVEAIETQFTRLDAAVTALKRSQANLKRYRAAVLKAACEGRLVPTEAALAQAEGRSYEPASILLERILTERRRKWEAENSKKKYQEPVAPDTSELPELPEGWCWATVEQLGKLGEQTVLTGPFGSNLGREDFTITGTPVLTIGCLTEQGLNSDKFAFISNAKAQELNRYRVREGDLLFSRMATVGRAGLVTRQFENAIFNYHLMRLRLADSAIRFDYFISYVRGSHSVTNYVKEVNHGATRDGINTEQLLALPVAVPPMAEQSRIVTEIERLLSIINQLGKTIETDLARANRLRQSILKRAFAGQLVPQDPNDEPASVLLERIKAAKQGQPVQPTLSLA